MFVFLLLNYRNDYSIIQIAKVNILIIHFFNKIVMNKIKKVKYFISHLKDEDKGFYLSSEIEYDENQNVLLSVSYNDDGSTGDKTISKYNNKGSIIEEINYLSEDEISEVFTFKRDDDDKITEIVVDYGDGVKSFKKYNRDSAENSLTITITDDEGLFEGKEYYKLNSENKITEKVIYNDENKIEEKVVYIFDNNSKVINQKEFDGKNELLSETLFYYDDNNNLVKQITVNSKKEFTRSITFAYDENGNTIEQKISGQYLIKYFYDEKNNLIKEERYYLNGLLDEQTEYEYDENNRLVMENNFVTKTRYDYEFFDDVNESKN
jgi:hypothetical protein